MLVRSMSLQESEYRMSSVCFVYFDLCMFSFQLTEFARVISWFRFSVCWFAFVGFVVFVFCWCYWEVSRLASLRSGRQMGGRWSAGGWQVVGRWAVGGR